MVQESELGRNRAAPDTKEKKGMGETQHIIKIRIFEGVKGGEI